MKSTFLERNNNQVKFTMEFSAEEFENALETAYKKNKGRFTIDGFRKGKAPRKLIETHYGDDIFFEDAVNDMLQEAYPAACKEIDFEPVDGPNMEFSTLKRNEPFTATVTVAAAPEVEVKDYKGIKISDIKYEVSDEDVDREMENARRRNARLIISDKPAADGDTVLIDYAGFVGDEQFEGGTAERYPLKLGSGSFIPGFEEQLIGAVTDADVDVKVTFPEEYHAENLAGKEAVFHCKVHEIKTEELPELNDDFAQDVSEFDTLDEYKQSIRQKLEESAAERTSVEKKNAVLEKLYEAHEVDIPEIMIEEQLDEMMEMFAQRLRYQGMDPAMYFKFAEKTPAEVRAEMRDDAVKSVKTRLLVKAVAKAEGITASDEEVEEEIKKMAEMYQTEPEKLKESLSKTHMRLLREDITNRKAVDFLFENAEIGE